MTTLTVRPTGSTSIGRVRGIGLLANYATVKESPPSFNVANGTNDIMLGQWTNGTDLELNQGFFTFDLSGLPSGAIVSSVVFEFTKATFNSSTATTQELLAYSAGVVGNADFRAFSTLSGLTKYGTIPSTGYHTGDTTYQISLNAAGIAAVQANAGGTFDFMIASGKMLTSTAPSGSEQYQIYSDDHATAANRPAVIITYTTDIQLAVPSTSLVLSGKVPSVLLGVALAVPSTALALTGRVPTVALGAAVPVPVKSLALTGNAPAVVADNLVAVPKGTMTLSAYAPDVLLGVAVSVPVKSVVLAAGAPSVAVDRLVAVPAGSLSLTGVAPAVVSDNLVNIPAGLLALSGKEPTLPVDNLLSIPLAAMVLSGLALQRAGSLWQHTTADTSAWSAVDADSSTWAPTTGSTTTWTPVTPAAD